jgi:hypothetical protein
MTGVLAQQGRCERVLSNGYIWNECGLMVRLHGHLSPGLEHGFVKGRHRCCHWGGCHWMPLDV